MLFSCDFTVELREDLWRDIININPIDFSVYMDSLTSLEFTAELLSCDTKYELDMMKVWLFRNVVFFMWTKYANCFIDELSVILKINIL